MNWKTSLDRYLTSEPPDDFTPYVESVYESEVVTDSQWTELEDADFPDSYLENELLGLCFDNVVGPKEAMGFILHCFKDARRKGVSFQKSPKTDLYLRIRKSLFA